MGNQENPSTSGQDISLENQQEFEIQPLPTETEISNNHQQQSSATSNQQSANDTEEVSNISSSTADNDIIDMSAMGDDLAVSSTDMSLTEKYDIEDLFSR